MRNLLRRWLGITALEDKMDAVRAGAAAALFDEHDPRRKAASDALVAKQIARNEAEFLARKMTEEGR